MPPRLADPFRPLLPHGDPFGEPCQVGTGSDEKRGLECLALPLVPVFAGVEAECDPGPFGQEVGAAVGNLPQLGYRGLDVQRLPARIAEAVPAMFARLTPPGSARRGVMAMRWTIPLIEHMF